MAPRKIMIIRHGEKPPKDGSDPRGIDDQGHDDADSLIVRGWQRAGALLGLFAPLVPATSRAGLAQPNDLVAAGVAGKFTSTRSIDLLKPLSAVLTIDTDTRFSPKQVTEAAAAIALRDGPVLVAWEHKRIGKLVTAIAGPGVNPPSWPPDRFDMVLVLDGQPGSYVLTQVPQLLLAGDSTVALPATGPDQPATDEDG